MPPFRSMTLGTSSAFSILILENVFSFISLHLDKLDTFLVDSVIVIMYSNDMLSIGS